MSDTNNRPTNEIRGDDRAIPDRGSKSGVTDTYGADLSPDAKNGIGGISGSTKSDPALDNCMSKNKR